MDDLQNDEGAVVKVNGKRAGAYRDHEGALHLVDTTCTHIGCEADWNEAERTWDCPCHGSRYSFEGEVIEGPAKKSLGKGSLRMINNGPLSVHLFRLKSERSGYDEISHVDPLRFHI